MPLVPLLFLSMLGYYLFWQARAYRNHDATTTRDEPADATNLLTGEAAPPGPITIPTGQTVETYCLDGLQQFQILLRQEARRQRPTQPGTGE